MAIDAPDLSPVPIVLVLSLPAACRLSTKISSTTSLKATIQSKPQLQVVRKENVEKKITREKPAFKKRRISSEVGDELQVEIPEPPTDGDVSEFLSENIAEFEEQLDDDADEGWDDLDKDDYDDPMMASEYVNEIFTYLKEVEVSQN